MSCGIYCGGWQTVDKGTPLRASRRYITLVVRFSLWASQDVQHCLVCVLHELTLADHKTMNHATATSVDAENTYL
jgi:hypothetical protein